jgi:NAD-dependent dihydropyrimidine dehydrogenase PreA subunit
MDDYPLPRIDTDLCTVCGVCVKKCPGGAVHIVDGIPVMDHPEKCTYCAICEELCPVGAISLEYEIM